MDVIKEIQKHLSIFKNMYDQIRVVDPNNKEAVLFDNKSIEISREKCNSLWENEACCENCISIKAFQEMDTLFKIDKRNDDITLITAIPTVIKGETYVVELIKEIKVPFSDLEKPSQTEQLTDMIFTINQKVIQDDKRQKKERNINISMEV